MRRSGLMTEVLASLALLMACATGVLALVLVTHQERIVQPLLAAALAREARAGPGAAPGVVPGTVWWLVAPDGTVRPRDGRGPAPDPAVLDLAREARRASGAVLQSGGGGPIRFAVRLGAKGGVAVARLPAAASARLGAAPRWVALGVLLVDVVVFTAFGASVLRRRLVLPLRRLRDAAEAVARGEGAARVPEDGAAEAADLATAFNAMNEALEERTGALEKAVADLRQANAELRTARAGLDRAERLAAVGRLAAGVAHEVGNPMGAVLAFLELAEREPDLPPRCREHLERAARQGARVREILRQLLDFSRPARGIPGRVDLVAAAEAAAALVRAQRRYAGIELQVRREDAPPQAWADPRVVSQILLNLLLNAADAVQGHTPARIRLRIRPAAQVLRPGDPPASARRRRAPDAVECMVEDAGPGVPEADRERIFDPFFTTKEPGEGTGLGLSNALRLAEESGGTLELAPSAPGAGAVFVLRLPAAVDPRAAGSDLRPSGPRQPPGSRSTGHCAETCVPRTPLRRPAGRRGDPAPGNHQEERGVLRRVAHGTALAPGSGAGAGTGQRAPGTGQTGQEGDRVTEKRRQGFTLVEVMVAVGIIGVLAALGVPQLRQWLRDSQVREAASSVANAFHLARTEAMRTSRARIVFLGQDIAQNPLNGGTGPQRVLVLDAGPPGSLDCSIDPGDARVRIVLPPDVTFSTADAGVPAPDDSGGGTMPVTFTQSTPGNPAAAWVLFRPDGVPVSLSAACAEGRLGTGGGAVYLSNGRVDYAVVLAPLGGVRVRAWERGSGAWN